MNANDTVTREIGNCQFCERDQKLHKRTMVHHGYERPGDGWIHGDCPGVKCAPYELSCDDLKAYLPRLRDALVGHRAWLARLVSGAVHEMTEIHWHTKEIRHYYLSTCTSWKWEELERSAISRARGGVDRTEHTIARLEARIAAWKLADIRTVTEPSPEAKRAATRARAEAKAKLRAEALERMRAARAKMATG